jgi:hypothetical protein
MKLNEISASRETRFNNYDLKSTKKEAGRKKTSNFFLFSDHHHLIALALALAVFFL